MDEPTSELNHLGREYSDHCFVCGVHKRHTQHGERFERRKYEHADGSRHRFFSNGYDPVPRILSNEETQAIRRHLHAFAAETHEKNYPHQEDYELVVDAALAGIVEAIQKDGV